MILVVLAIAVAYILGLTFLATSTTVTSIARTMDHHAQARQIAESGLRMTIRYVEDTGDWRDERSAGAWISEHDILDGTVIVSGEFNPNPVVDAIFIDDSSFEREVAELPTPMVSPPMSGVIGGWEVARSAAVETGATVPRIGVRPSADATDGDNIAFIAFTLSVDGSATFAQSLGRELQPYRVYEVVVDIAPGGLPLVDTRFGFRVLADGELVASTEHAAALALPAGFLTPPAELPIPPEEETLLEILGLSGGFSEYTLRFATDAAPLPGELRLELFAESAVSIMEIAFDNVRFREVLYENLSLTTIGRHGNASHSVAAALVAIPEANGGSIVRIVQWGDRW